MPTRDEMTIDERRKYVKLMAPRYQQAKRKGRSQLLSEMEQVSKLHRKHVIRLLNGQSLDRKKRRTARSRSYGLEVEGVVLRVWESLDYICAERLTPSLLWMARHLASFGVLVLSSEVKSQLAKTCLCFRDQVFIILFSTCVVRFGTCCTRVACDP